jgi:hypothetical protein
MLFFIKEMFTSPISYANNFKIKKLHQPSSQPLTLYTQQHTSFSARTTGVSNPDRYPSLRTSASVFNSNMPSPLRNPSSI